MNFAKVMSGPISGLLLLTVPVLALVSLSPWSAASQATDSDVVVQTVDDYETSDAAVARDLSVVDLSGWQYTGKSDKSAKSEKSKKSPKSVKSEKSEKSKKSKKSKKKKKKRRR